MIYFQNILITFLTFLSFGVFAQTDVETAELDSLSSISNSQELSLEAKTAFKATWHSAVLPTWGQWDNKQQWKSAVYLPLIASGLSFGISAKQNANNYNLAIQQRANEETADEYFGILSDFQLTEKYNAAKRNQKLGFALAGTSYGVQVLDAYVFSIIKQREQNHSPAKAAFLSAIVPGWGQIYNRKYWKLPIVYGALGVAAYFIQDNARKHKAFKEAYINYEVDEFTPESITVGFTRDGLLNGRQIYLRNLEVSWIIGGALYAANILDAVVDAHLFDFDVSDDLSIKSQPFLRMDGVIGASFSVRF